jgi:hypothetical protein
MLPSLLDDDLSMNDPSGTAEYLQLVPDNTPEL